MASPLVSIVTPAYNQARYLREAIDSVLAQTYPLIEYIVIDDGSIDGTVSILREYSGRVRWEAQPNMGQAQTLNKGWRMSTGTILGYLSADDVLFPDAVQYAVQALEEQADVVMVYPNCDLIDPHSRTIGRGVARSFSYEELVLEQQCHVGPGAFFRRWAFELEGGWKPQLRLAPDREFWMRIGLHGRIVMIPSTLAAYRMHPETISFSPVQRDVASEYVEVTEAYFSRADVPAHVRRMERIARSRAHIVEARLHLRAWRIRTCVASLRAARGIDPQIAWGKVGIMLARAVLSRPYHRLRWSLRRVAAVVQPGPRSSE